MRAMWSNYQIFKVYLFPQEYKKFLKVRLKVRNLI